MIDGEPGHEPVSSGTPHTDWSLGAAVIVYAGEFEPAHAPHPDCPSEPEYGRDVVRCCLPHQSKTATATTTTPISVNTFASLISIGNLNHLKNRQNHLRPMSPHRFRLSRKRRKIAYSQP